MKKWVGLVLVIGVLIFAIFHIYTLNHRTVKITTNEVAGHYEQATKGPIQVTLSKPQVEKTKLKSGTVFNVKMPYQVKLAQDEQSTQTINIAKAIRVSTADNMMQADKMNTIVLSKTKRSDTGVVTVPLTMQAGDMEQDVLKFKVRLVIRPERNVRTIVNY